MAVIAELDIASTDEPNVPSEYPENVYETPDCNPVTTIGLDDPVLKNPPGFE